MSTAVRGQIRLADTATRPALAFTVRMPDLTVVDVVEYETAPDRWRRATPRQAATFTPAHDGGVIVDPEPQTAAHREVVPQDAREYLDRLATSQAARRALARAEAAELRLGHRATWYAVVRGERFRNTSTLRGVLGWDVVCSCGWDSKTGGATRQSVADDLWVHRTLARRPAPATA